MAWTATMLCHRRKLGKRHTRWEIKRNRGQVSEKEKVGHTSKDSLFLTLGLGRRLGEEKGVEFFEVSRDADTDLAHEFLS
ncbi:hypothetical protein CEXT_165971 [Caerostris extrusa]|uniref:Uncharacterized protein n=1 Tax=Caerostris extrusa TaxID=172846 RepID=A0AAV4UYR5_CAEEX|nr:hypothetical protein CEXT_165971 [Caerostris extrusa]